MKKSLLSALFLTMCGFATAAHASAITFNFAGGGNTASGTFTATQLTPGVFQVTGITGQVNGAPITALSTYNNADNLIYYSSNPQLDSQGLSFQVADFGIDINLYSLAGYFGVTTSGGAGFPLATFDLATAPEPSSGLLVGSGLLGVAGLVRRRILAT